MSKKGEGTGPAWSYMISIIIGVVVIFIGCTVIYKYENPNCDPEMIDYYSEFLGQYESCLQLADGGGCEIDFSKLDGNHGINLKQRDDGSVLVSLECFGSISNSYQRSFEDTSLCFDRKTGLGPGKEFGEEMDVSYSRKNQHYKHEDVVRLSKLSGDLCFIEFEESHPEFFPEDFTGA